MVVCDMCGKEKNLIVADIEGTELNVCNDCAKFGKIIRKIEPIRTQKEVKRNQQKEDEEEIIERIIENFGKIIKEGREKLNLKQDEFANKINEKASIIHSLESEHHEPNIKLANKIEKFLKIKLIEEETVEETNLNTTKSENLTIGDLIKKKE
jgi:putative transcription factor|tara:strand:- start:308 stop:766 length:459 start_codon:yes stop_codon:yes gene_type:complete